MSVLVALFPVMPAGRSQGLFIRDADGLAETELCVNLHTVPSGARGGTMLSVHRVCPLGGRVGVIRQTVVWKGSMARR